MRRFRHGHVSALSTVLTTLHPVDISPQMYGLALPCHRAEEHCGQQHTLNRARQLIRRLSEFCQRRKEALPSPHGLSRSQSAPAGPQTQLDDGAVYTAGPQSYSHIDHRDESQTRTTISVDYEASRVVLDNKVTSSEPESIANFARDSRSSLDGGETEALSRWTDVTTDDGLLQLMMDHKYGWDKVTHLQRLLEAPNAHNEVMKLNGHNAQRFLDFGDWILTECQMNRNEVPDMDNERWFRLRQILRRLVVRLIQLTSLVPQAMYIHDICVDQDQDKMPSRLGSGSYADVYCGRWRSTNTIGVAIKVFRPIGTFEGEIRSEDHLLQVFLRELAIQRYLYHPNICRPLGVLADRALQSPLCIVFPRMVDGNITQYLRRHPAIKQTDKYAMYLGLARALAYIHSENVVHGDIHGGNVLVQNGVAQLADFGVANFADSTQASVSLTRTGASRWMAPEILLAEQEDGPVKHTPESDVFSFGMLMLQMHTVEPPFAGLQPGRIKYKIIHQERPARPAAIHDVLWQILQDCWRHQPDERPPAESLVARLEELEALCPSVGAD